MRAVINIHGPRDLHNERSAARRRAALRGFCCSNRSRFEFYPRCCAVLRVAAFCVNAAVDYNVID